MDLRLTVHILFRTLETKIEINEKKGQGRGMTPELTLSSADFERRAISPLQELGAYEALWDEPKTTFKTLSEKFAARPGAVPSDFVPEANTRECAACAAAKLE